MAGLEVMASLAPKSSSIFKVRDNVPWQIVCMALAKISKQASMYGRLKYSLEYSYHKKVRNIILKHVMSISWRTSAKWKPDKDFFVKVADLALKESLDPMCCPKCSGRGNVVISDTLYTCTLCLGVGIKSMHDSIRSDYLGVHRNTFRKQIKHHYFREVLSIVREWEDELIRAFKRM